MKSQHLFENNIYLISNFTVAHNRIFGNQYACRRFLKKLDHYLSPICQIYQYVIAVDQFHILVKLKDRSTFEKYFQLHSSKKDVDSSVIPFTSYIFSQAMANLQSSAAIHHNRKCNRKGAVFARRYQKHLVECKQELDYWISQLNEMKMQVIQTEKWRYKVRDMRLKMSLADRLNVLRNGYVYFRSAKNQHPIIRSFVNFAVSELQGQFDKPLFRSLKEYLASNSPP